MDVAFWFENDILVGAMAKLVFDPTMYMLFAFDPINCMLEPRIKLVFDPVIVISSALEPTSAILFDDIMRPVFEPKMTTS